MTTDTHVPKLRIISLGWGVQSFTLAAMAAVGEIPPVDYAIHADTTHEAAGTYAHAAKWTPWLEARGVKVLTVVANRPDVVREDWSTSILIPAFTSDRAGNRGQTRRQCTYNWKIRPIRRRTRELLGGSLKPGSVQSIQGISLDEWQRMRTSDVKYIVHDYPLVDLRMTRGDCVHWLQTHDLDIPPKSACTFCPYHNLSAWKALKRAGGPDWDKAVAVDEAIRHKREHGSGKPGGHEGQEGMLLFVHPACKSLPEAVDIPEDHGAEQLEFEIPCDSGMCFV